MEREGIFDERFVIGLLMVAYFDDAVCGGSECTPLEDRAAEHAKVVFGEGWRRFVEVYTPHWAEYGEWVARRM